LGKGIKTRNIKNQKVDIKIEEALRADIRIEPSASVGMIPDRKASEHQFRCCESGEQHWGIDSG
jgi:hypothetical protein